MSDPLDDMKIPQIEKGIYLHYKNKRYEVIGVALHSETHEALVMYKPLYDSPSEFWVRPYAMFTETITLNGQEVPRFRKISG